MLHSSEDLRRLTLHATDGELGHLAEFYFDDQTWTVRYFIVRTGGALPERTILLPPSVVTGVDLDAGALMVSLTVEQVRHSPDVDTDQPVSRLQELEHLQYYEDTPYWMLGAEVGGSAVSLNATMRAATAEAETAGTKPSTHLRSSREVRGYQIAAPDGTLGQLHSYLISDKSWRVRFLVVHTGSWFVGKQVVIAPEWVSEVSWGGRCLRVDHSREQIKQAPPYTPGVRMTSADVEALEAHYGRRPD